MARQNQNRPGHHCRGGPASPASRKSASSSVPATQNAYRAAAGPHGKRLQFVEQNPAAGLRPRRLVRPGVHRFVEPFLLLVGDHLYLSRNAKRCARQLVEVAAAEACAVSAVQATHESKLPYYGVAGGRLAENARGFTWFPKCWRSPRPPWPSSASSCPDCAPAIISVSSACTC